MERATPEEMSIIHDLHKKCGDDVIMSMFKTMSLLDNITAKFCVSLAAPYVTGMAVSALMQPKRDVARVKEGLHDQVLFGLLFSWISKDDTVLRDGRTVADDLGEGAGMNHMMQRTKAAWEAVTGRTFDHTWLRPELHKHFT